MDRVRAADEVMQPTMRSPAKVPGPRANRSIGRLLEATKTVFLDRGYAGTTVDEIARVAGMSRASFYTYFPTKRDALLALGVSAYEDNDALDHRTAADLAALTEDAVRAWVDAQWAQLDEHGGFSIAWTQAARDDDELRVAGMRGHLRSCRSIGRTIGEVDRGAAEALGLVVFSMIERSWSFCSLYGDAIDHGVVRAAIVRAVRGMVPTVRHAAVEGV